VRRSIGEYHGWNLESSAEMEAYFNRVNGMNLKTQRWFRNKKDNATFLKGFINTPTEYYW
jgi:hypothetical protein